MKKVLLTLAGILTLTLGSWAQAKKPTIMVVPSDAWCNINGYTQTFDNQGKSVVVPDYKKALQENTDLLSVISKINEMMTERGFPLKNLESALKTLESNAAEDAMTTSKSGAELSQSPVDKLKQVAKADIIMQLTWTVVKRGPETAIDFAESPSVRISVQTLLLKVPASVASSNLGTTTFETLRPSVFFCSF